MDEDERGSGLQYSLQTKSLREGEFMPERRTPFYDFHRRSARNLVKGGGNYMFPTSYASSLEEHLNVRRNVGMQDLSTMGEVDIKGPGAERLVRRLLVNEVQDMEPGELRFFRFAPCRIGDIELFISRSGYTGELGYELYTPADQAGVLWEYLLEKGRAFDLRMYGVEAMQSLRIEKG